MRDPFLKLSKIIITLALFFITSPVFAYQTVFMDFPGNWYKVNYVNNERDTIVQFVRKGYNRLNWEESVVFHSYKWTKEKHTSAKNLMYSLLNDVGKKNKTLKVEYIKVTPEDTLVSWCVDAQKDVPAHCELLRTTQGFDGALSMHYINKNTKQYKVVRNEWQTRISKATVYQNYYRLDRILNKSMTFEL